MNRKTFFGAVFLTLGMLFLGVFLLSFNAAGECSPCALDTSDYSIEGNEICDYDVILAIIGLVCCALGVILMFLNVLTPGPVMGLIGVLLLIAGAIMVVLAIIMWMFCWPA